MEELIKKVSEMAALTPIAGCSVVRAAEAVTDSPVDEDAAWSRETKSTLSGDPIVAFNSFDDTEDDEEVEADEEDLDDLDLDEDDEDDFPEHPGAHGDHDEDDLDDDEDEYDGKGG